MERSRTNEEFEIRISLVIVDLYPFEATVASGPEQNYRKLISVASH